MSHKSAYMYMQLAGLTSVSAHTWMSNHAQTQLIATMAWQEMLRHDNFNRLEHYSDTSKKLKKYEQ